MKTHNEEDLRVAVGRRTRVVATVAFQIVDQFQPRQEGMMVSPDERAFHQFGLVGHFYNTEPWLN